MIYVYIYALFLIWLICYYHKQKKLIPCQTLTSSFVTAPFLGRTWGPIFASVRALSVRALSVRARIARRPWRKLGGTWWLHFFLGGRWSSYKETQKGVAEKWGIKKNNIRPGTILMKHQIWGYPIFRQNQIKDDFFSVSMKIYEWRIKLVYRVRFVFNPPITIVMSYTVMAMAISYRWLLQWDYT